MHISSGAIVQSNDQRAVLVLYRAATNSWHLPKGTQVTGETLEQTALREVREETGYDITLAEYVGWLDSCFERSGAVVQKRTHYFMAHLQSDQRGVPDGEHDEARFMPYAEAVECLERVSLYEHEGKLLRSLAPRFVTT